MQDLLEATRRATADIRSKDPLANRRRRRENRPQIPKNIHKELLGSDGKKLTPEDLKQADALWKMLDDMYETDPEEYKNFIEKQMQEGKEAGFKLPGQENVDEAAGGKQADSIRANPKASFTPNGGFVVKTKRRYTGDKVFLNMCSHPGVQIPTTANGSTVKEDTPGQFARQIPLLISAPREGLDGSKGVVTAFDCVFNPWVITTLSRDNMFKVQVVELAMQWVENDHGVKLNRQWKSIKSKYKLGGGSIGNKPVPFPIEDANAQNAPDSEGQVATTKSKKAPRVEKEATSAISSPGELLKHVRQGQDAGASDGGINTSPLTPSTDPPKKPLIQEIGMESEKKGTPKETSKKKKKCKKAVKKGFLTTEKAKGALYPTGSNEGGPKTFLDKCKIVDTTKMNQSELEKTMKDYAAPGGNRAPPKKKAVQPAAPQVAKRKPAKAKASSKKKPPVMNPVVEAEFDALCSGADPEGFASNVQTAAPSKTGDAQFDSLAQMLAGGSTDLTEMFKQSDLMDPTPSRKESHSSFMEDLGKTAMDRGFMPPASAVDTYKESVKQEKKKTRPKVDKESLAEKPVIIKTEDHFDVKSYVDLGEDAWELE